MNFTNNDLLASLSKAQSYLLLSSAISNPSVQQSNLSSDLSRILLQSRALAKEREKAIELHHSLHENLSGDPYKKIKTNTYTLKETQLLMQNTNMTALSFQKYNAEPLSTLIQPNLKCKTQTYQSLLNENLDNKSLMARGLQQQIMQSHQAYNYSNVDSNQQLPLNPFSFQSCMSNSSENPKVHPNLFSKISKADDQKSFLQNLMLASTLSQAPTMLTHLARSSNEFKGQVLPDISKSHPDTLILSNFISSQKDISNTSSSLLMTRTAKPNEESPSYLEKRKGETDSESENKAVSLKEKSLQKKAISFSNKKSSKQRSKSRKKKKYPGHWEPENVEAESFKEYHTLVEEALGVQGVDLQRSLRLLSKFQWNKLKTIDNIKKNKVYYKKFLDGLTGE